jgi:arabinose-5-phosphate isomerase
MNEHKITRLFVLGPEGRQPIGILHIHDCLRAGLG